MLSIRFDDDHEWWAPGSVVERLFVSAVKHGRLAPELEEWRHIADANGGALLPERIRLSRRDYGTGCSKKRGPRSSEWP
jgi:hypothetical protein